MKKIIKILLILVIGYTAITLKNTFSTYKNIALATNKNYKGVGQEEIENQDGYFATFKTINNKIYKEYKQNMGSWKDNDYWDGTMEDNGCGITAMSIILSGYDSNYTPEDLRNRYYPAISGNKIASELENTFHIKNSDFYFDSLHLSNEYIINHLNDDKPILICVWNDKEKNRWTTQSHYMVLLATDGSKVYVSNPNGLKNQSNSSGWYDINEITPYLAKALYIY